MSTGEVLWKVEGMPRCPAEQPIENSIFVISGLKLAGLEDQNDERSLFFRKEAIDLWRSLDLLKSDVSRQRGMHVVGSPGVGKSSAVWTWLCSQNSRVVNKKGDEDDPFAFWVHVFLKGPLRCVILKKTKIMWRDFVPSSICELISSVNARFFVLDGCREDDKHDLRSHAITNVNRKRMFGEEMIGIYVSSMSERTNANDERTLQIITHEVPPWTLEEQIEALKHPEFLESVQDKLSITESVIAGAPSEPSKASSGARSARAARAAKSDAGSAEAAEKGAYTPEVEDLVKEKHFYAGGNAQWMFALTKTEVLTEIHRYLYTVIDKEAFMKGIVSISSKDAANHLMIRYMVEGRFKTFFASKYIAREILTDCDAAVFRVAYSLAETHRSNPAFLEWVVEFDFIAQLTRCKGGKLEFVDSEGAKCSTVWDITDVINFDPRDSITVASMPVGACLKPTKWNEEAYDLVFLLEDQGNLYLRFVQITNAVEHYANLAHFQCLADKVKTAFEKEVGIHIVLVSPQQFRGKNPTRITLRNAGALTKVSIGATAEMWTAATAESKIQRLFFKAERRA